MYDYLIIGAGITGTFIARDLSKYDAKVAVLEKANDVACGATMANSAIVHCGHDPEEGTLKAKFNIIGSQMYEKICKELNVGYEKCGAFVCSTSEADELTLQVLFRQAVDRGIKVVFHTKEEAIKLEPNLSDTVQIVMELPDTAIIYPWEVAIALMECAINNGAELYLNSQVTSIERVDDYFIVNTTKASYQTKAIINAAGIYSDKIYAMVSDQVNFKITPRKGEYFVLDKSASSFVSRVIYPIPSVSGKGVLVVPTTHRNILVGPNSQFIDDADGNDTTESGLEYVKREIQKTMKNIPYQNLIRTFSGVRPTSDKHDFIIEEASDVKNFINVASIESPGLASAPAISQYVVNDIIRMKDKHQLKIDYNPKVKPYLVLRDLSNQQKNEYVKSDSKFGNIICRCEEISEGEIVQAINRTCGATTIKGVKKRVRPGMGRCQGGFCEPRVAEILARELNIDMLEVLYDGTESQILKEDSKVPHE